MTKLHGKIASDLKPGAESGSKRIIEMLLLLCCCSSLEQSGRHFLECGRGDFVGVLAASTVANSGPEIVKSGNSKTALSLIHRTIRIRSDLVRNRTSALRPWPILTGLFRLRPLSTQSGQSPRNTPELKSSGISHGMATNDHRWSKAIC
jgi:hypothetical protein